MIITIPRTIRPVPGTDLMVSEVGGLTTGFCYGIDPLTGDLAPKSTALPYLGVAVSNDAILIGDGVAQALFQGRTVGTRYDAGLKAWYCSGLAQAPAPPPSPGYWSVSPNYEVRPLSGPAWAILLDAFADPGPGQSILARVFVSFTTLYSEV